MVSQLAKAFDYTTFEKIPRKQNYKADAISKMANILEIDYKDRFSLSLLDRQLRIDIALKLIQVMGMIG